MKMYERYVKRRYQKDIWIKGLLKQNALTQKMKSGWSEEDI